ncbi:MAG: helix-turn-helix transcriptional regulator [Oscillospiraceae bacterium]|nr:helix-turn-helix transcriptional regulator [Oscillospiraceae bacterium]
MAEKKVGTLIREARTAKKLSQEQLAAQVNGLSGSDIGKAERGEKELTQAQLKTIAKVLGVTQKSLVEAPKGGSPASTAKTSSAAKTSTAAKKTTKTSTATKKTTKTSTAAKASSSAKASSTSSAKKTTASKTGSAAKTTAAKTTGASKSLTAAEQKFLELYRAADADDKKLAAKILKGEKLEIGDMLPMLLNPDSNGDDGLLGALIGKLQNMKK